MNMMLINFFLSRRFILRKTPNIRKLLCAVVVTLSPVVYLIPNVSGVPNLLWPLLITIHFVSIFGLVLHD